MGKASEIGLYERVFVVDGAKLGPTVIEADILDAVVQLFQELVDVRVVFSIKVHV